MMVKQLGQSSFVFYHFVKKCTSCPSLTLKFKPEPEVNQNFKIAKSCHMFGRYSMQNLGEKNSKWRLNRSGIIFKNWWPWDETVTLTSKFFTQGHEKPKCIEGIFLLVWLKENASHSANLNTKPFFHYSKVIWRSKSNPRSDLESSYRVDDFVFFIFSNRMKTKKIEFLSNFLTLTLKLQTIISPPFGDLFGQIRGQFLLIFHVLDDGKIIRSL